MNIKEIKERAEQRALGYNNSDVNKQDYYLGYCDGAVDQKKIDIDKACELVIEIVEDLMARNCEIWSKESKRKTLENVRNAMGDITTIEGRARDYTHNISIEELKREGLDTDSLRGILHGYIKGAHGQKKIDIDKACEWLENNINIGGENTCSDIILKDFRKAMEE